MTWSDASPKKQHPGASAKFQEHVRQGFETAGKNVQVQTLKKYKLRFKLFVLYIKKELKGGGPVTLMDVLPADPTVILAFLAHTAETSENSYSQCKATRTAIYYYHKRAGHGRPPSDPCHHDFVQDFLEGMRKTYAKPPKKARCPEIAEVIGWFENEDKTFRWVRIRAILAIQIGAGCRLDEVLSLTPYDLQEFLTEIGNITQAAFLIERSKTDAYRQGEMRTIAGVHFMEPVQTYLQTIGMTSLEELDDLTAAASVFRQARSAGGKTRLLQIKLTATDIRNHKHVSKSTIQAHFKDYQKTVSPNCNPTTLHGNRAFFATQLDRVGTSSTFIKKLANWKSDCFLRYIDSSTSQDAKHLNRLHDSIFPTTATSTSHQHL